MTSMDGFRDGSGFDPGQGREHRLDVDCPPPETLAAVGRAAEAWGADYERGLDGGRIELPVAAGIRHGVARGQVRVRRSGSGSSILFHTEETVFWVHTAAVALLVMAAGGGLLTVIWPFFPALLPLAPLGGIVALAGWFLVVSRLTTSTPDDFLRLAAELAAAGEEEEEGDETGTPAELETG